jgi:hypothetical protein
LGIAGYKRFDVWRRTHGATKRDLFAQIKVVTQTKVSVTEFLGATNASVN